MAEKGLSDKVRKRVHPDVEIITDVLNPKSEDKTALFYDLERLVGVRGTTSARALVRQDVAQASLHLTSYPQAPGKR